MSQASIGEYYWAERRRECAAGRHRFGGWRKDDDGRDYWRCANGCGHQHRNDPQTPQERDNETGCRSYQRHQDVMERKRRRTEQADERSEGDT